jgi:hypothetical protein
MALGWKVFHSTTAERHLPSFDVSTKGIGVRRDEGVPDLTIRRGADHRCRLIDVEAGRTWKSGLIADGGPAEIDSHPGVAGECLLHHYPDITQG